MALAEATQRVGVGRKGKKSIKCKKQLVRTIWKLPLDSLEYQEALGCTHYPRRSKQPIHS